MELLGVGTGTIRYCYNLGKISITVSSATQVCTGGIIGHMNENCNINNCYSIGAISASVGNVTNLGLGMIGHQLHGNVSMCYYLDSTSQQGRGYDLQDEANIIECLPAETMRDQRFLSFLNDGSGENIFLYDENYLNNGLPVFYWQTRSTVNNNTNIVKNVRSVSIDPNILTLKQGEEYTLNAIIQPSDATNQQVNWSSEDENIVRINNEGTIYANSTGNTIITVVTDDGNYSSTCKIVVLENPTFNQSDSIEQQNDDSIVQTIFQESDNQEEENTSTKKYVAKKTSKNNGKNKKSFKLSFKKILFIIIILILIFIAYKKFFKYRGVY